MTEALEKRLEALEAENAIRKLKYTYLNACDRKDVETIRACFTEDAELDYPPIGKFGLDGLIDIFTQMAATTPITDVHQAHNGEIILTATQPQAFGISASLPMTRGINPSACCRVFIMTATEKQRRAGKFATRAQNQGQLLMAVSQKTASRGNGWLNKTH